MATVVKYGCALLVALVFAGAANGEHGEHGIEVTLSKSECYPGDLVELQATMTRSDLAEFDLALPRNESLHLVAKQLGPVTYGDGLYRQNGRWMMQPTQAGEITLAGIKGFLKQGETVTEFEVPSQTLNVRSYAAGEDSFEPEPLPPASDSTPGGFRLLVAVVLVGGVILGLVLFVVLRSKPETAGPIVEPEPTLDDVKAALEGGDVPTSLIESLLTSEDARLSAPIREALEQAVYGKEQDRDGLLALLNQEGVQ